MIYSTTDFLFIKHKRLHLFIYVYSIVPFHLLDFLVIECVFFLQVIRFFVCEELKEVFDGKMIFFSLIMKFLTMQRSLIIFYEFWCVSLDYKESERISLSLIKKKICAILPFLNLIQKWPKNDQQQWFAYNFNKVLVIYSIQVLNRIKKALKEFD